MAEFGELTMRDRFRNWRQLHPRLFWLIAALIIVGVLFIAWSVFARVFTFKRAVSYDPCQVDYGQTVADWDGGGDETWNEQGYHYETKRFLVKSTAPRQFFPNVAETPPTELAGSNPDGSQGCQSGFNGLVDTNLDTYQWFGAKPMAARLGLPALGEVNSEGAIESDDPKLNPSSELTPPVFANSHRRAAAWVDDGAQAVLQTRNRKKTQLLWCQGQDQPVDGDGSCSDITDPGAGELPQRGNGYLFTDDNCPQANPCDQADTWYAQEAARADPDYTKLIGTNNRGELLPFYLHLSAVSTYANTVGTWMTVSFKYPIKSQITNEVTTTPATVPAGGTFDVAVKLSKIGPDLNAITVNAASGAQPIKEVSGFGVGEETLLTLNNNQSTIVSVRYQLTGGSPGQCFDLPLNIEAVSSSPNPDQARSSDPHKVTVDGATARYCVQQPGASASYTYEVNSRGNIQSDLNEFIAQSAETLASSLGWTQAGASFKRVASNGDFTLVLSSPDQMTTFSSGCDAMYSCRAGRFVVINDERWRTATPSWNSSGGSLRNYRHMVVNHEVGHWLGFGHLQCPAAGAPAPVMQQQSISLQGCKHNPWPTPAEINTLKARL